MEHYTFQQNLRHLTLNTRHIRNYSKVILKGETILSVSSAHITMDVETEVPAV